MGEIDRYTKRYKGIVHCYCVPFQSPHAFFPHMEQIKTSMTGHSDQDLSSKTKKQKKHPKCLRHHNE